MDKIWLKSYQPGVPHNVDAQRYASLATLFEDAAQRFRTLTAFTSMGSSLTYGELDRHSRNLAAFFQMRGLVKGDRVAVMMPNLLQYPVALIAALRAGLVVVNCNPMYTSRELEHQLKDSGARAIVVLENFAHTLEEVVARTSVDTVITTEVGDLFAPVKRLTTNLVVKYGKKMVPPWHIDGSIPLTTALAHGQRVPFIPVDLAPEDLAFLQYTGGTTGVPKGAMLAHVNLLANLEQASAWMASQFTPGSDIVVMPLPLYHVFALTVTLVTSLKWGANHILIANPRELRGLLAELKKTPFTLIVGVNTLYRAIADAPGFNEINTSALKVMLAGGMAVQRLASDKWKALTGRPIIEGYGLTETSPFVSCNRLDTQTYTGTVGLPFPSTEVSIRDDDGIELPLGETGEVCVRGPQVMKGYWNRPEETSNVMYPDGFLRTGDMGYIDEAGFLKLTDRKKDMIVVSGFKVYPNEVEEVAMAHPGVLEAVAIGMPDERTGQAVRLVVVRKEPTLTAHDLMAHCRKHLTAYKLPRSIVFRSTPLPKSAVGKVLRRLVRDEEANQAGQEAIA
ncbi:MAG TPA: AMP-binding protein [Casimicrobiaceae bacterium]|nr:AMP-binding protein [Casimicrobiaceae bacterium]